MFTEPVSSWTMSLKRRASYMLLPAVIWWLWAAGASQCRKSSHMHPMPAGRGLRTGTHRLGYPCNRKRVGDLLT